MLANAVGFYFELVSVPNRKVVIYLLINMYLLVYLSFITGMWDILSHRNDPNDIMFVILLLF